MDTKAVETTGVGLMLTGNLPERRGREDHGKRLA
jgi:hypothetical protein